MRQSVFSRRCVARSIVGVLGIAVLSVVLPTDAAESLAQQDKKEAGFQSSAPTVVILVRHAEKQSGEDPELTTAGRQRAEKLATMLRDADLTAVHSTDFRRTRSTARPTAEAKQLDLNSYDPRDLPAFAEQLREQGGRHLVVGHSNTTPALVKALGGEAEDTITEDEFDRLYIVTLGTDGRVSTVLLRYGG